MTDSGQATDGRSGRPVTRAVKRSCDQCKLRKIRCNFSQPCETCQLRGFDCTYLKPQKKRGPVGKRLAQIQREQDLLEHQDNSERSPDVLSFHTSESVGTASDAASSPSLQAAASEWQPQELDKQMSSRGRLPRPVPDMMETGFSNDLPIANLGDIASFNQNQEIEYWLPDSASSQVPSLGFPMAGSFVDFAALPPIIDTDFHETNANAHLRAPGSAGPYSSTSPDGFKDEISNWPTNISEVSLIPWIDVYFERLHPTIPVFNRSTLFTKLYLQEHRHRPLFGSMILALCAFAITQPILISERPTSSSREHQAKVLMNEAIRMRSSFDFGENPTLEAVMTSFYLFGSLFGTNQHNAAWLRLREAIDLAQTMELNSPETYEGPPSEEKGQNLRAYMVLFITERAYAIQRRHPTTLKRMLGSTPSISDDLVNSSLHGFLSGIIVYNEKDAAALMGLSVLMQLFSAIQDETIDCWNATCAASRGGCSKSTAETVLSAHARLARVCGKHLYGHYDCLNLEDGQPQDEPAEDILGGPGSQATVSQHADLLVSQKWLLNRAWHLCLAHNLLKPRSAHPELQFDYAILLAESTLALCQKIPLSFMEAHGVGLIEKLYDIAVTAIAVLTNPMLSRDQISGANNHFVDGVSQHQGHVESSHHNLIRKYYKMFTILRGGNHPYLEKYIAHLHSLGLETADLERH